jgi:CubicO group peptidase (beta-lactamase class C family)
VLLLAERGSLALTDPISRFLPDYPRGDEIVLAHLLGHSSGIPDHHDFPGFEERTADGIALDDLVAWQSEFPLEFDPGTQSRYGNSGYAVLARVVEVVAEASFPTFLRENLLAPLGMQATEEVGPDEEHDGYAGGHARGYVFGPLPTRRIGVPRRDYSFAIGSGSLRATADDLLAWLCAVDAKRPVDVGRTPWPYGWGKHSYGAFQALEQTGAHAGFTAAMTVVPEADVYVVHLSNVQAGLPFQRVHRDVASLLLGLDVEPPPPIDPAPFDPREGARLAGYYDAGLEWTPILSADARGLWWSWTETQAPQYLEPIAPGRFLLVVDGCELVFLPVVEGKEPRFELREPWRPDGPFATYVRRS